MSGTSKAIVSICVLLLAGLVVYYGMTPTSKPVVEIGDIPTRATTDVKLFGRDLDAAAAALGISPAIAELTEPTPALHGPVVADEPIVETRVEASKIVPSIEKPEAIPTKNPDLQERAYQIHTVVSGDTLGEIAHAHLGSARHASEIAALNKITDPRMLQLGQKIKIPNSVSPVSQATNEKEETRSQAVQTHIIQEGETLSDIAEEFLGSPNRWSEIWDANRSRISNPDRLKVGVLIEIP